MFYPVVKVKILNDEELVFGPGLVTLMEYIGESGSMKEACGKMGMSYSKGWKIVNRAETELKYELIARRHGGNQGGKCELTEQGRSLIERYRKMEEQVKFLTQEAFEVQFPEYQK